MKINRLWIQQLGDVQGLEVIFDSGWNHIVGDNESGKTTIFTFIQAMLFGFKGSFDYQFQNHDGGILEFELQNRVYILERYYDRNKGRAVITTLDQSQIFNDKWLQEQLQLSLKEGRAIYFMNPFYLMEQSKLSVQEFQLLAFSILQSGTNRLQILEKQYDKQLRLLYKKRGMGIIQMDMNTYLQKKQQIKKIQNEENKIQCEMQQQKEQRTFQSLLNKQKVLIEQLKQSSIPNFKNDQFIKYALYRPQALNIKKNLKCLRERKTTKQGSNSSLLVIGLFIVLMLLCSFSSWRVIWWIFLIVIFGTIYFLFYPSANEKGRLEWNDKTLQKWCQFFECDNKDSLAIMLDKLEEQWHNLKTISVCDMNDKEKNITDIMGVLFDEKQIEQLKSNGSYRIVMQYVISRCQQESVVENAQIQQQLSQIQNSIQQCEQKWTKQWMDSGRYGKPIALLQQEKSVIYEKLMQDLVQYQKLKLKKSWLKDIQESYQENQLPSLLNQASYYFARLTGYQYKKIQLRQDEFVVEGEEIKPIQFLSTAARQQLLLSMRFAFIMSQEEGLPMILDEIWVFFDTKRQQNLFHLLEQLASSKQIISFATSPLPQEVAHKQIILEECYD